MAEKDRNIILISFLNHSINVRGLASFLRLNNYRAICFFCCEELNTNNVHQLVKKISTLDPIIVGISLVTDDYPKAVLLTSELKKLHDVPVIWGGAHVNVMPEESLKYADMICMGEGEEALLELLENSGNDLSMNTSIRNIWFKTKDGIIRNGLRPLEENLDKYPFPENDKEFLFVLTDNGVEQFAEEHLQGVYNIMTSRGCPYQCDYCYNSYRKKQYEGLGRYLRMRSIENVIEELKLALKLFPNLKYVQFWDDCFIARTIDEIRLFKELYLQFIDLPFFVLIEPMIFNYERVALLKDCGLHRLQVGVQTGSERVNREVYNRKASNKKVLETARYINKLGVEVVYDVIFNNPYETVDDIKETIELVLQFPQPFELQGYNLIFYPETKLTIRALADGYISSNSDAGEALTIQGRENSPITMRGAGKVSERFYRINYSSDNKLYWNGVVSLLASNYIPKWVIRYFKRSGSLFNRIVFKAFIHSYSMAAAVKHYFFDQVQKA